MPKLNHGERELSFEMHRTRPVPESRVDWRGCGLASHLSEGSFQKNKTSWISSHIRKGSRHGVHEMRIVSLRPIPRQHLSKGTRSLRERARRSLGSRLRGKDARFPSFWRGRGWRFGFSSDRQWGGDLCRMPLAALIGLAFGGRWRRDRSSHYPICLQSRGA